MKPYTAIVTPKDGKIQTYLRYTDMRVDTHYKVDGGFSALGRGLTETLALSHMTLDLLGSTLRDLIAPRTEQDREQAKEMVA
jgi:hypothetical protein